MAEFFSEFTAIHIAKSINSGRSLEVTIACSKKFDQVEILNPIYEYCQREKFFLA